MPLQSTSSLGSQYCMLIISNRMLSSKKDIDLDFGAQNSTIVKSNESVIQETLKVRDFYTVIDALNYMASIGWQIEHLTPFDTYSEGGTKGTYRYLMKRFL
jgi:hypothetical protein